MSSPASRPCWKPANPSRPSATEPWSRHDGGAEIPDHIDAPRRQGGGLGAAIRMPGEVDEHQRASLDRAQPWRLAGELRPVEEDYRFADGQFLGYLTDRCQGGRWQLVELV